MSAEQYAHFIDVLEVHENLLHAETQAIAAKHLDTIEEILEKKETSLSTLLSARENLIEDPRKNEKADEIMQHLMTVEGMSGIGAQQYLREIEGDMIAQAG